ncbi:MAG: hypothetical protein EA371_05050 [Gammaproteobacteria bacterium]|nr:MAG: hypothetical protein EA371_05050 [Gammaproteobacteria bacterium]
MKLSLKRGVECWFDVDNVTISVWASNWTGREIVRIQNGGEIRVVSDKRSFRLNTPHEFELHGQRYRLEFRVKPGIADVRLYRNGELIDSDLADCRGIPIDPVTGRLDWRRALKTLALPILAAGLGGAAVGYLVASLLK